MSVDATGIGEAATAVEKILGMIFPDKTAVELQKMADAFTVLKAQTAVIQTEASSGTWITAAWRPITMLTFVVLIVCRVFGFTSEHITAAEYMQLWELVKLGLGGYVLGRSAEKIVPATVAALKS